MIKIGILIVVALFAGCASTESTPSGSLRDLTNTCTRDRAQLIRNEWLRYEFTNFAKFPNGWEINAHKWAKKECKFGRNIPAFHPQACQRGSIVRCRS